MDNSPFYRRYFWKYKQSERLIKQKLMNVESLKKIGGQVLLIVVGVLLANEIQKQIDKRRAAM